MPTTCSEAEPDRITALEAENAGLRLGLAAADDRNRLLLAELQHRVRNVLAVINAVARRTAEMSGNSEEYALHLDGRIGALARAQGVALRDRAGGITLDQMIAEELLAHAAQEGDQVSLSGPPVRVSGKALETFWLVMHELSVNAVKYGALSTAGGRIEVTWRLAENGAGTMLLLHWREQGGPPPAPPPRRRSGFGTEVIERTLHYELGATGKLNFEPDGISCVIQMPLTSELTLGPTPPSL